MCDGYAQSTQHARVVSWLERGPLLHWLHEDTNATASDLARPMKRQRAGRPARLQASVRSPRRQAAMLRATAAGAGAQPFSVEEPPASQ
jgi:hypothetical protein